MTPANNIPADQTPLQPSPQLQAVPGYKTTSGQFTAIFTVVALLLSLAGFHYSPTQIENWVQGGENLLTTLGPLLALIPVLITYINSRGKITSTTLNANAAVLAAPVAPPVVTPVYSEAVLGQPANFAGGLGLDLKKPETYQQLLHIAGELGVPGAHQADAISQKVPVADLLTGILGMLHHKAKSNPPQ